MKLKRKRSGWGSDTPGSAVTGSAEFAAPPDQTVKTGCVALTAASQQKGAADYLGSLESDACINVVIQ